MFTIMDEMKMTEFMTTTTTLTSLASQEKYFDNCRVCGRSMITTNCQLRLMAACPEWRTSSLEEVRSMLISGGVNYLFEVSAGHCHDCSADPVSR